MSGQRVNKGQSVLRQRCMCVGVFLLATYGDVRKYQATVAKMRDFFRLRARASAAKGTCYFPVIRKSGGVAHSSVCEQHRYHLPLVADARFFLPLLASFFR